MNIFSKDNPKYKLQEAWNKLDPEEVITLSHYELADKTDYSVDEWRDFLCDGKVSKFIEAEMALFKQSQMNKLIKRATTNDKSVGTAQMLNAISKSLDDDTPETQFFIYSHVPLTPNEAKAPLVREEPDWQPRVEQAQDVAATIPELKDKKEVVVQPMPEPSKEVEEDEWF